MDLGTRLRMIRTASGRTIASVAADAGLSVPYIANLENDRGNPTLASLGRLAEALGMRLVVDLEPPPTDLMGPELEFIQSERFQRELPRLARRAGVSELRAQGRMVALIVAASAAAGTEQLSMMDCHRLLDVLILTGLD